MKKVFLINLLFFLSIAAFGQKKKNEKVIYQYKKYQKFDFEDLTLEGNTGSPGDLTNPIKSKIKVVNKLPYRLNFNPEIRKGIERIR